jgi:predicted ATP-grasp superfamily ATP-dependent carboligase
MTPAANGRVVGARGGARWLDAVLQSRNGSLQSAIGSVPILVLKQRCDLFHHGGLAISRSAGELGIEVVRVQEDRWAPSGFSRFGRGVRMPPLGATKEQWLDYVLDLGRGLERAVLVPIDDVGAVFVDDHAAALREYFLFPDRPPELSRRLSDKAQMHALCLELGIPTPSCELPTRESDVTAYVHDGEFPVVVKQIDGWHPTRDPGAPSVMIARTPQELLTAYRRMDSDEKPNVMIQEYVPGGTDTCWMFNGYFDERSECLFGAAGRKLRQQGPRTGPTTLGECLASQPVEEATKQLARAVGYRGIIDIGFRYDRRDDTYKLLDVNPRIGGSFRLFVGEDGMDVVRALYLDMTGRPVAPSRPRHGRRWLVEPYDTVASLQLGRAGDLTAAGWAASFRGVQERAWLAWSDPLPFFAMVVRMLLSLPARRSARRAARRTSAMPAAEPAAPAPAGVR